MKNKKGLVFLMLLILTHSSFAQQSDYLAPEATAAETKLSYRDIPNLKKVFIDAAPKNRKDGIQMGELGVDGGNKAMILKLAQEIADNKYGKYDSFLIAHKGKLLFESYYLRGRINLPHYQASTTKTYTSLALGRVIQMGYLTMADLDKPLVSFLKDLDPTKFVEGVEKITLNQALTMRTGIRISKEKEEEFKKNPRALKGQGRIQVLLENSAPITTESQSFKYGYGPGMVMQVIDAVVPGTAKDFIENELLDKMNITNYGWRTAISGLPESGWRTRFTSRDMIKWGTLAMNKGKWNGEQLVPETYIAKATSRILYTGDDDVYGGGKDVSNQGYGYFWWNGDLKVGNKSYFSTSAQGGNGQYIILIEELDLMVVITAHDNDNSTLQITAERIIPAFTQNSTSMMRDNDDNQNDYPALEERYLGQKPPGLIPEPFAHGRVTTKNWEYGGVFTPNLKEFYFIREVIDIDGNKKQEFVVIENKFNEWKESVISPRVGQPFISPDGMTMHLGKRYKKRNQGGDWLEIKKLGSPFEEIQIMRLTASLQGTYVFDEIGMPDGDGVIRYSRLINGKREEPRPFGKEINTGKMNAHPFISPDESYLIWDGERDSGYGDSDIYISFKQQDGSWGAAINLGDKINTEAWEAAATVTPDGKYLFFNRNMDSGDYENVDIFWVDAKIIEDLRPKQ
ncbi:serine hydrolase [Aquimarina sp. AU474]|uniref:serine hydrolase n=1 Tax=Aquimarina sp. AU474 TaxID=2108529 RepID=UPI00190F7EAE|nr:serine hydrolase [Aquimarina sp. AU474]